ncbi:MAG: arginine--tRNA ligase [Desulfobacteraceae bacterium]|nr:arginine--tRNA ligase [Desulfobacteraceae bacterium]MBC2755591.1 arginine--tRNA ligase [Desulfobacteraceae bacterium]
MKKIIRQLILDAANKAFENNKLNANEFPEFSIEEPKVDAHGDLSTNFAMVNAKTQKMAPRKIAEILIRYIGNNSPVIEKTEIAGPGFINFFILPAAWYPVLSDIYEKDTAYGFSNMGNGQKVQVEFVSANPTGPLHVGHGRGAIVGDSVASILTACGYDVHKEYYINDAGKQIQTLGLSVFLRCRELDGHSIDFPEDCYQGDYIYDIARELKQEKGDWVFTVSEEKAVAFCAKFAADRMIINIRNVLNTLGIEFDNWYSEQALMDSGKVASVIQKFKDQQLIYEKDDALWFKTEAFGDEKDRVVVRNNGQGTYFASDIAYHQDKLDRGFDRIIDVWGADHHGYIPRIRASITASGKDENQFVVILTQLVNLLRKGVPVSMGKRSGQFITLKEVIDEVGKDAVRFIFLTRHYESPLDFDLEVAKQKTNDNPVYYVQYVHARISSIIKKAQDEKQIGENEITDICFDGKAVARIKEPEEIQLIKHLARYPETIRSSAEYMEPHRMAFYLMDLAADFHAYYNKHRVLTEDPDLTAGRLYLIFAVQKVIRNGLTLLGVSAPDSM